jgi:hypothetical protein
MHAMGACAPSAPKYCCHVTCNGSMRTFHPLALFMLLTLYGAGQVGRKKEPKMDFVAMELCIGIISSGVAHQSSAAATAPASSEGNTTGTAVGSHGGGGGTGTAWDTWLWKLLEGQFNSAALEKGCMWAFAVAQSIRAVARDVSGASLAQLHPCTVAASSAKAAFAALLAFVSHTAATWTGTTLLEAKTIVLLRHAMENLLMVSSLFWPMFSTVLKICLRGFCLVMASWFFMLAPPAPVMTCTRLFVRVMMADGAEWGSLRWRVA